MSAPRSSRQGARPAISPAPARPASHQQSTLEVALRARQLSRSIMRYDDQFAFARQHDDRRSGISLSVNANFVSASVVNWNGAALSTTYVSARRSRPRSRERPHQHRHSQHHSHEPAPGGALGGRDVWINNPVPASARCHRRTHGRWDELYAHLTGSGFVSTSVASWNGAALTTIMWWTQITAQVPASDLTHGLGQHHGDTGTGWRTSQPGVPINNRRQRSARSHRQRHGGWRGLQLTSMAAALSAARSSTGWRRLTTLYSATRLRPGPAVTLRWAAASRAAGTWR